MCRAQKLFAYFCKSLSIFDWLSDGNPENDTGLSDSKLLSRMPGMPLFHALPYREVLEDIIETVWTEQCGNL